MRNTHNDYEKDYEKYCIKLWCPYFIAMFETFVGLE